MIFSIREATPQDASAIAQVQVASWRSTYSGLLSNHYLDSLDASERAEQWQLRLMQRSGIFLIVEDSSGLFGFAAGGPLRSGIVGYDAELYAIYLLRDKQGIGAGRSLVCAFAQQLAAESYQTMVVWSLSANPSRGFYERLGGLLIAEDHIEIGGELLPEVAYGWASLGDLIDRNSSSPFWPTRTGRREKD